MHAHTRDYRPALPDAIEAAEALLGAILVNNDAYWRVAGFLKPSHFTEKLHGVIYETIGTMITEGRAVNPITVKPYLPADQMIGDIPVFQYVVRLASEAVTVSGASDEDQQGARSALRMVMGAGRGRKVARPIARGRRPVDHPRPHGAER